VELAIPVLMALFLASLVESDRELGNGALRVAGVLVGVGQGLALFWRRSYPITVLVITAAGGLVVLLLVPYAVFPYAGLVALWALAAVRPPWISLPALAVLLGVTAVGWPVNSGDTGFALGVVTVVWALGEATRNRLRAIDQAARRALAQDQARLARELHDVIAHSVSVMVVQAAAADDVFDHSPERARTAVRAIEETGREALAELRRLLAALGSLEPGADGLRPQPGLDRIGELAEPLRAVGLRIDLCQEIADSARVPAGVGLSAYRIVQEALTNTVRHAQAGRVEVSVRAGEQAVEVSILDDGCGYRPGPATGRPVAGRGIAGMRERAEMLGGTLEAGPRPGGGFGVRARLPLREPW
jgi:signal transduction histidine kinase